jgi:hypothetical protein
MIVLNERTSCHVHCGNFSFCLDCLAHRQNDTRHQLNIILKSIQKGSSVGAMIQWLLRTTLRVEVSTDDAFECLKIRISFVPKNVLGLWSRSGAPRVSCVLQKSYYIAHDMRLICSTHRHAWLQLEMEGALPPLIRSIIVGICVIRMRTNICQILYMQRLCKKRAGLSADLAEDLIKFLIIHIIKRIRGVRVV